KTPSGSMATRTSRGEPKRACDTTVPATDAAHLVGRVKRTRARRLIVRQRSLLASVGNDRTGTGAREGRPTKTTPLGRFRTVARGIGNRAQTAPLRETNEGTAAQGSSARHCAPSWVRS